VEAVGVWSSGSDRGRSNLAETFREGAKKIIKEILKSIFRENLN